MRRLIRYYEEFYILRPKFQQYAQIVGGFGLVAGFLIFLLGWSALLGLFIDMDAVGKPRENALLEVIIMASGFPLSIWLGMICSAFSLVTFKQISVNEAVSVSIKFVYPSHWLLTFAASNQSPEIDAKIRSGSRSNSTRWEVATKRLNSQPIGFHMFLNLKKSTIYIKFNSDLLTVRHVETKKELSDKPLLAIDNKRKILAFGGDAAKYENSGEVINGFEHPRSFISDPIVASETMKCFLRKVFRSGRFIKKPTIIFHPLEKLEGGLTGFEIRGLRDVGEMILALKTYVWVGRELTDNELEALHFPESDGQLFEVKT